MGTLADIAAQTTVTGTNGTGVAPQYVAAQANWLIVAIFFTVAIGIGVSMLFLQKLFQPSNPNPVKSMAYESGMPPIGEANQRYTIRYYLIAMLFVVFDIEAVFFYPWAVAFNSIGWYGLIEMVLFIVLLLVAYIYAWRKGALDWVS